MPTYQYACTETECGHRFELVQSFTDPAASECPVCGHRVRKVYGSVGVVFKGSGFYRTDSRSEGKSSTAAAGTDGKSTEKKPAESTTASSNGSSGSSSGSSGSGGGASTGPAKAAASA